MRYLYYGLFVIAAYLALAMAPLFALLVGPDIPGRGRPSGAGVLCDHLHRRPGIDRGGGFCWPVGGWVALAVMG